LTCERCSDQGYVDTGLGRLACLECSAAAALTWIPATKPPACGANPPTSRSILCLGVIVTPDGRFHNLVAYWPARDRWTATRLDGMEPADIEVEVIYYMELSELLASLPVAQVGGYVDCLAEMKWLTN
jgi:hypothetical protein